SQSAAATVIPGVVFSGSLDGHLRAYSTRDGSVAWDFDTASIPYAAVNGAGARGGALDGGGPIVAGGVLYVNSGYGRLIGQPAHLLFVFTVDGKCRPRRFLTPPFPALYYRLIGLILRFRTWRVV